MQVLACICLLFVSSACMYRSTQIFVNANSEKRLSYWRYKGYNHPSTTWLFTIHMVCFFIFLWIAPDNRWWWIAGAFVVLSIATLLPQMIHNRKFKTAE